MRPATYSNLLRISPSQACEDFNAPSARPSMGNSDVRCFAPEWSGLADSVTHRQRATKRYLVPFHLPGMPTTVCSGREAKHLAVPTTPRSTLRPPPAANKALCCCLAKALAASVVVLRHANILHGKKRVESKTRNCGEKKGDKVNYKNLLRNGIHTPKICARGPRLSQFFVCPPAAGGVLR